MSDKVFGKGNKLAKIMFIGEAPGAQEVKQGIPFVGKSGKTLDEWINQLRLTRDEVYITNLIKEKLPKNRNPTADEVKKYLPMLMGEIGQIDPQIIITLGLIPLNALLSNAVTLNSVVGSIQQLKIQGKDRLLMPLYHPAYINRAAEDKKAEMLDHVLYLRMVLDNV